MHIQVFNVQNFTTKMLLYHGEDQAERLGQSMKKQSVDGLESEKVQSTTHRNRPQFALAPQQQLLSLNPDQVRTSQMLNM